MDLTFVFDDAAVFGVEPGEQRVRFVVHLPRGAGERQERPADVEEQQL